MGVSREEHQFFEEMGRLGMPKKEAASKAEKMS